MRIRKNKLLAWMSWPVLLCTPLLMLQTAFAQDDPEPPTPVVELTKYLTSGPCVDDVDSICQIGFYGDFDAFNPELGFEDCGASGTYSLNAEGFTVEWSDLYPADPDCGAAVPSYYAALVCTDGTIIHTMGSAETLEGAGSLFDEGLWPDPAQWLQAVIDCRAANDLPFIFLTENVDDLSSIIGSAVGLAVVDIFNDSLTDQDIAWVIETLQDGPTHYDFILEVEPDGDFAYDVEDAVPAEWSVVEFNNSDDPGEDGPSDNLPLNCGEAASTEGVFALMRGGKKGKNCSSATDFWWMPATDTTDYAYFEVETRENPSNGKRKKGNESVWKPTGCGPYYLNDGAVAMLPDMTVIGTSNDLCLAAVEGDLLPGDGYGQDADHDTDTLASWTEACDFATGPDNAGFWSDPCVLDTDGDGLDDFAERETGCTNPQDPYSDGDGWNDGDEELVYFTDPCDADTDDDGYNDDVDACPLDAPDALLGELDDGTGCPRQSQCSDDLDNDNDGLIDFDGGDASCDAIDDDTEDSLDDSDADGVGDGNDGCPAGGGLTNTSFEDPDVCHFTKSATGWTTTANSGVYDAFGVLNDVSPCTGENPETETFQAGVAGDQVGYSANFGDSLTQSATGITMSEGSTYQVCADVGDRTAGGASAYNIELQADTLPVVAASGIAVNGDWVPGVCTEAYEAQAADAGDAVTVLLQNGSANQVNWDNVILKVNGLEGCNADLDGTATP